MYEPPSRKKTEVVSFRLPAELVAQLRKEAQEKRITASALLSQILHSHFELYSPASAVGMFLFPKATVCSMLKRLDNKTIRELSNQTTSSDLVSLAVMAHTALNTESIIDTVLVWSRHSGFQIIDTIDEGTRTIILKHDMGMRWSLFMRESLKHYLSHFNVESADIEMRGELLIIKIRKSLE
jgi:hypothetical protein